MNHLTWCPSNPVDPTWECRTQVSRVHLPSLQWALKDIAMQWFSSLFKGEEIVTQGNSTRKQSELYWLPHIRTFKSQTFRDENVCSHVWSRKLVHMSGVHCHMRAYIHAYISIYVLIYRWLYNLAEIGRENARAGIYNWSGSFGVGEDGRGLLGEPVAAEYTWHKYFPSSLASHIVGRRFTIWATREAPLGPQRQEKRTWIPRRRSEMKRGLPSQR